MSKSSDRLFELLPMIYRQRDEEQGWPLRDLLRVIAEQVDVVETDITQLYENWFIETCQDWVVPYIGDLVGYQSIHNAGQPEQLFTVQEKPRKPILIPRREVAKTIRARQHKGTLRGLKLVAKYIVDWPVEIVEFYKLLSRNEHINHQHLSTLSRTVDLRQGDALQKLGSPIEELAHSVDVRSIASKHNPGCYNIPNIGVFIWRLKAYSVTRTPAFCLEEVRSNCYTFSVTGNDTPLYTRPEPEADPNQIAPELNLPIPIRRQFFKSHIDDYYGPNKSLQIWKGASPVPADKIIVADLSDWYYQPPQDHVAVDPELGRFLFPPRQLPKNGIRVSYHYGFSADIGGGEYDRPLSDLSEHLLLSTNDIKDTVGLIAKLKDISALSRYLRSQFSANTQTLLYDHTHPHSPTPQLLKAVIAELNQVLLGESLYDGQRFASVILTEEINWLANQNLQSKELLRLNRLLLEQAYPDEIGLHYAIYKVGQDEEYHQITEAIWQWQVDKPLNGVIEITDSGVYVEQIRISLDKNQSLELRAANHKRPVIRLLNWRTALGDALSVTVKSGSSFTLDGLLITGRGVKIESDLSEYEDEPTICEKQTQLTIRHSTLVPGWALLCDCEPQRFSEPSLELFNIDARIRIEHSIIGAIQVNHDEVQTDPIPVYLCDSILDATRIEGEALSAVDGSVAHAQLTIERCTVFGQIRVRAMNLAENSIFNGTLYVVRRQLGCVRFCYVTPNSRTPRRYNCQPDLVESASQQQEQDSTTELEAEKQRESYRVRPQFNSTRYGTPTYCQLADNCAEEIKRGASDESEMGVFHDLYQPQKATNLRVRLDEYTPAGMEAGIIYAT